MSDTVNPKKEILEMAEGEVIEAIELFVNGPMKNGHKTLVPKMFKGNQIQKALSLLDKEVEDEYGGCGVHVTAWTKNWVLFSIDHQDSQTCWTSVERNPG